MASEKTDPLYAPSADELEIAHQTTTTHTTDGAQKQEPIAHVDTKGIHEFRENEGYVLDQSSDGGGGGDGDEEGGGHGSRRVFKLAADGHTRLIPQPSDDPNDPLNWSSTKKHLILFVIAAAAFLPDFGSATGAVTLELQAAYVLFFSSFSPDLIPLL